MVRYSEEDRRRILSVPILEVLRVSGRRTDHDRYHRYFSPFRDETNASFRIYENTNRWYDFGTGESGGVIDLVTRLKGCSKSQAFDFLATITPSFVTPLPAPATQSAGRDARGAVVIERLKPSFTNRSLVEYIASRGIPRGVIERYCFEAAFRLRSNRMSTYFAIAFPNNSGGYVLRSRMKKMCTSSDVTTIGADGVYTKDIGSSSAVVFEGFFDFLSWLVLYNLDRPMVDVCVLNSTVNWTRAASWLAGHSYVTVSLDNDSAGRKTFAALAESLERLAPGLELSDGSAVYAPFKDYNDKLADSLRGNTSHILNTYRYGTINQSF